MDPSKKFSSVHMYIVGYSYEQIAIFTMTCKVLYLFRVQKENQFVQAFY